MKVIRWSLLLLVLLAPLSVGCGGHSGGPTATTNEAEAYFAAHPDEAIETPVDAPSTD